MAGGAPQEDAKQEEPAREEPKKKPREEPYFYSLSSLFN